MDFYTLCLWLLFLLILPLLPLILHKKREVTRLVDQVLTVEDDPSVVDSSGRVNSRPAFPPSPPKLPIIGNLHYLSKLPHRSLWWLSQKHGPVMLYHAGSKPVLVISSAEMAREVLKTHDHVFCNRPPIFASRKLFRGIAFAPYGDDWREMRKICVLELFSARRVQSFQSVRIEEVANTIDSISLSSSCVVDLREKLKFLTDHIFQRIAFGTSYKGKEPSGSPTIMEVVHEYLFIVGTVSLAKSFPYVRWIVDLFLRLRPSLKRKFHVLHSLFQKVIEEHKDPNRPRPEHEDIVDVLLQLEIDHRSIKAVLLDILVGGIDTSTVTMVWAMAELVKNPGVMKKVQDEVRSCVGNKANVEESDLHRLHYLKMVLKETLRLHPPGAILIPRESMKHCYINGYDVYPETMVIVNIWAIGRDPESWNKPEEFFPERFMESAIDYKGHHFEFLPFGAGRRGCPGISLGSVIMELTLANLLYSFNWKLPTGMTIEDLDMEEAGIFHLHKKSGLQLVPTKYDSDSFRKEVTFVDE
ncbi:hypothetical protein GIB67_001821 [Kingdonia uniflora]|uniref:Cytochrome P450 n=1 Tax=Kingdonia uniflora TaxID=39325 RepID=A0A7J7LC18_9MAGN|nr:hypothetical protein GIB67_001821 [Kingdonia uniflora]